MATPPPMMYLMQDASADNGHAAAEAVGQERGRKRAAKSS
jgi:hypothetical protein